MSLDNDLAYLEYTHAAMTLKGLLEEANAEDELSRSDMLTEARIDELLNEISFGDIGKKIKGAYAKSMKKVNAPVKDLAAKLGNWQKWKSKVFKDKSAYNKAAQELESILKEFENSYYQEVIDNIKGTALTANFPNISSKDVKTNAPQFYKTVMQAEEGLDGADPLGKGPGEKGKRTSRTGPDAYVFSAQLGYLYHSYVEAKKLVDADQLEPEIFNAQTVALRRILMFYLDFELDSVYKVEESVEPRNDFIHEIFALEDALFEAQAAVSAPDKLDKMNSYVNSDGKRQKFKFLGASSAESKVMKRMKSKLGPILMMASGPLLGLIMKKTGLADAFADWLADSSGEAHGSSFEFEAAEEVTTWAEVNVPGPEYFWGKGEGLTQFVERISGDDVSNMTMSQFQDLATNGLGIKPQDYAEVSGLDPSAMTAKWLEHFTPENADVPVGEYFAPDGDGSWSEFDFRADKITNGLQSTFVDQVPEIETLSQTFGEKFTSGAGDALAKGAVLAVLSALGVGTVAAGGIILLMRQIGLRQSRAAQIAAVIDKLALVEQGGDKDDEVIVDPPVGPTKPGAEGDFEVKLSLAAKSVTVSVKNIAKKEDTPEDEEYAGLDVEGLVPDLPMLVELGITSPESIKSMLNEVSDIDAVFTFKGAEYPEDEGTFGGTFQNMEDYPTLQRLVGILIKRKREELKDLTPKDLETAIKAGKFELQDLRNQEEDPSTKPTKPTKPGKGDDRPRLGLVRMDDDGLKIYRSRGGIGDEKYNTSKTQFQSAQDNALVGNTTSPTTKDIETHHGKGRRGKPVSNLTYDQMVGRQGLRGKDLKKGVEVDPYFTVDQSAHSDLYLRRRKTKKMDGVGTIDLPRLGKKSKGKAEELIKQALKKFVSGKKKLSRQEAQIMAEKLFGDSHGVNEIDDVVNILVAYGLVGGDIADPRENAPGQEPKVPGESEGSDKPGESKTPEGPEGAQPGEVWSYTTKSGKNKGRTRVVKITKSPAGTGKYKGTKILGTYAQAYDDNRWGGFKSDAQDVSLSPDNFHVKLADSAEAWEKKMDRKNARPPGTHWKRAKPDSRGREYAGKGFGKKTRKTVFFKTEKGAEKYSSRTESAQHADGDLLIEEKATSTDPVLDRWSTLAGIGESK